MRTTTTTTMTMTMPDMSREPIQIVDMELCCPKCAGSIAPVAPPQSGTCDHGHNNEVFLFRCLDCKTLAGLVFEERVGGGTLVTWAKAVGDMRQVADDDRLMN
jgi:hypothetical protein